MSLTAADCLRSTATEWGSSRWAAHNRCGRESHLRYTERVYRLPLLRDAAPQLKPTPFHVGTLVHAGIRLVETRSMASAEAIAAVADAAAAAGSRFTLYDIAESQRLLSAYWAHYGEENALAPGWHSSFVVKATELQLSSPHLQHTGAIDTLLQHESGELLIVDTKTRAQKLPEDAAQRFATAPQFLSLSHMLQHAYRLAEPPPVMVNAIMKTQVPGFERVLVRFTQAQVDRWVGNQKLIEAQKVKLLHAGLGGAMNYSACAPAIGNKCDYFAYCHGSDEERELHYGIGLQQQQEEESAA